MAERVAESGGEDDQARSASPEIGGRAHSELCLGTLPSGAGAAAAPHALSPRRAGLSPLSSEADAAMWFRQASALSAEADHSQLHRMILMLSVDVPLSATL